MSTSGKTGSEGPSSPGEAGPEAGELVAGADSPKRHGDKLGIASATADIPTGAAQTGDSPKPHGDKLAHAVEEAAKG